MRTPLLLTLISACTSPVKRADDTHADATADAGTMPPMAATDIPCEVADLLQRKCQSCHGALPSHGAPMSLVSLSDLTAPAHSDPTQPVYERVLVRVRDRARPMPPDPSQRLDDAELAVYQTWAEAGAHAGPACTGASQGAADAAGAGAGSPAAGSGGRRAAGAGRQAAPEGEPVAIAGSAAVAGRHDTAAGSGGSRADVTAGRGGSSTGATPRAGAEAGGGAAASDMPQAPDTPATTEQCYELRAHGSKTAQDTTHYGVPVGETYTSFIFKTPWTQPVQGLRFRHLPDDVAVLHHWILYTERARAPDGDIQACDLSGLLGFLCGQGTTRSMITGWAPGREEFTLPDDVGLELPAPGTLLALEVHYFNFGAERALDRSGVEVCVTPEFRPHTASVSWLGTESIRIPANAAGAAMGTCTPRRSGLGTNDPIHVLYSWPHMHKLGRHLTTVVNRSAGAQELLYDGDFSFDYQILHPTPLLLQSGDTLTTRCNYENTTNQEVRFGQSTTEEMCFNFVYAWPAHALDNPDGAFGEAGNTCLH